MFAWYTMWPPMKKTATERELVSLALALGARSAGPLSPAEESLARMSAMHKPPTDLVVSARNQIRRGVDVLGELFCALRSPMDRRLQGAVYTPRPIVKAMLGWAAQFGKPARIVDPGAGSGRFLVAAGRQFAGVPLVGIELDPLAGLLLRAHLASAGLAARATVMLCDYRDVAVPPIEGRTLYLGNPPYVRHHLITQEWKQWLTDCAGKRGLDASQLAGLHVHFFLATVHHAALGDFGAFITSAEWLDVNYGRLLRQLFLGDLGGRAIHVIEPTANPFPDAATTGAITCFEIGSKPKSVRIKRISDLATLGRLDSGSLVRRERLEAAQRWTPFTRSTRRDPDGYVELGELCRVHRGQVTGANRVWVVGHHELVDLPSHVLKHTVTRARELFANVPALDDLTVLRRVIDLPVDLDSLTVDDRRQVDRFLTKARSLGAHTGYIARSRKAWWAVQLRDPAPILATYMARRPPAFVLNRAAARHINIAHGIYPREPMTDSMLSALSTYLSTKTRVAEGRTYAGGLTKFEPREMERLLVPSPALLWNPALCGLVN